MIQRGFFSISTLILSSLQERPKTKTRLEHELVLNYERVSRYCEILLRQGLVELDTFDNTFLLTPKGLQVLILSEELAGFLTPVKNMICKYQPQSSACQIPLDADAVPGHAENFFDPTTNTR